MKLKVFLVILSVAAVAAVSLMVFLPPKVTVTGEGTLAISNYVLAAEATPDFELVDIVEIQDPFTTKI